MRLNRTRMWFAFTAAVLILIAVLLYACESSGSSGPIGLTYKSKGWSYRQVAHGAQKGFQATGFNAGSWKTGQAGFGTTDGICSWNVKGTVNTPWQVDTDMLLRHDFRAAPSLPGVMRILGNIDNSADVYVNGALLKHVEDGYCNINGIDIDIPAKLLRTDNLLAIRAGDVGAATYIDVEIIYVPPASPSPS